MRVQQTTIVFDVPDLHAASAFWATLLDGSVSAAGDWHTMTTPDGLRMGFQLAPGHVPPQWPDGDVPQQLHLDVAVDSLADADDKVRALGGTLLQPSADPEADQQFAVYADPAGHPFCLTWERHTTG